jgi:hypothetical protein
LINKLEGAVIYKKFAYHTSLLKEFAPPATAEGTENTQLLGNASAIISQSSPGGGSRRRASAVIPKGEQAGVSSKPNVARRASAFTLGKGGGGGIDRGLSNSSRLFGQTT